MTELQYMGAVGNVTLLKLTIQSIRLRYRPHGREVKQ